MAEHDLSLTSITFDLWWPRVRFFQRMRRIDARRGTEKFKALFPTEFELLTKNHQGGPKGPPPIRSRVNLYFVCCDWCWYMVYYWYIHEWYIDWYIHGQVQWWKLIIDETRSIESMINFHIGRAHEYIYHAIQQWKKFFPWLTKILSCNWETMIHRVTCSSGSDHDQIWSWSLGCDHGQFNDLWSDSQTDRQRIGLHYYERSAKRGASLSVV